MIKYFTDCFVLSFCSPHPANILFSTIWRIILIIFPFPFVTCRRGGTDYVPGQKQTGQETCQCHSECGSPSSAGLVILHWSRRHDEEAARDPDFHQCHQGWCILTMRIQMHIFPSGMKATWPATRYWLRLGKDHFHITSCKQWSLVSKKHSLNTQPSTLRVVVTMLCYFRLC